MVNIKNYIHQLKNSAFTSKFGRVFGVDVFTKIIEFLLIFLYVKLMTQDEFGLYGYLSTIILVTSGVLNCGLYTGLIRLYSVYEGDDRSEMMYSIAVSLLLVLIFFQVMAYGTGGDIALVNFLISSPIIYENYRMPMCGLLFILPINLLIYSEILASENIKRIQSFGVIRLLVVNSVVVVSLLHFERDAVEVRVWSLFVGEILLSLILGWRFIRQFKMVFQSKIAIRCFKIGIPVMLGAFSKVLYDLGDRYVLEKYVSMSHLGIYNLALRLSIVPAIVMTSIQAVYVPIFFKKGNLEKKWNSTVSMAKGVGLGFVGVGLLLWVSVWSLSYIGVLSNHYQEVMFLLPILLSSTSIQAISGLFINFMTYFETTYVTFIVGLLFNVINVWLNTIFIPENGLLGATAATLFSSTMALAVYVVMTKWMVSRRLHAEIE